MLLPPTPATSRASCAEPARSTPIPNACATHGLLTATFSTPATCCKSVTRWCVWYASTGSPWPRPPSDSAVSLPTCFRMVKAFARQGLAGLLPQRRGPRGPHKVTSDILQFVDEHRTRHGHTGAAQLVPMIEERFGVKLHPRGLEKALARRGKNAREPMP